MLILLFSCAQPVYWEAWSEHTKVNLLRIVVPVYQIQLNHESPGPVSIRICQDQLCSIVWLARAEDHGVFG